MVNFLKFPFITILISPFLQNYEMEKDEKEPYTYIYRVTNLVNTKN